MEGKKEAVPTVVWSHEEAERILRERWDDPRAEKQNPLVVVHMRSRMNQLAVAWFVHTILMAWERCKSAALASGTIMAGEEGPNIRVICWSGGNQLVPLGRTDREWAEKSVLAIGMWRRWLNDQTLRSVINCLYGPESDEVDYLKTLQYIFRFCEESYNDQCACIAEAKYDALEKKEEGEFIDSDGRKMKAALLTIGDPRITAEAWRRKVMLIVSHDPNGSTALLWSAQCGVSGRDIIARAIRVEEARAGAPLSLERIMKIVGQVLNPNSWEPGFAVRCKMGFCGSGRNGNRICPRKAWRLPRCEECRLEPEMPKDVRSEAQPAPALEQTPTMKMDAQPKSAEPTAALNTTTSA